MRFKGMALMTSLMVLGACGGEKKAETTTTTTATTPPAATTPTPAATGTAAPITGKIHEVAMVGDEKGMRYEPKDITVKAGDGIRFTTKSLGPHNVAFDPAKIPADVKAQLDANFGTDRIGELSSGLKMNPGESFTLSLGAIKPGKYEFNCTPHLAMNMIGTITVTP